MLCVRNVCYVNLSGVEFLMTVSKFTERKKKIVANVFTSSIIKVACPLRFFISIRALDDLDRVCEQATIKREIIEVLQ